MLARRTVPIVALFGHASMASSPRDRGLAGPGLLAITIVHRWQGHLPLYRLESSAPL